MPGATETDIGDNDAHFQRWLGRYGMPDAYSKWRAAYKQEQAPFLAFVAIASETRLLMRLSPDNGSRLVRDALIVLKQIEAAPTTLQTTAAAEIVKRRLGTWQQYIRSTATDDPDEQTQIADRDDNTEESVDRRNRHAAQDALKNFPQFRASTAGFLISTARSLGATGMLRLGPPMDMVFALGSARVAARTAQGREYEGVVLPPDKRLEVIGTVQEWSLLAGKNALIVPGYPGHGQLVRRVLAMALDAHTCADLAKQRPKGTEAEGFEMWEIAEEYHAYALMLFDTNPLHAMTFDKAVGFASAAGRLAERAISDPDVLLPELPDVTEVATPKRVLIYARSLTGGSIAPRRSTATGGAP